MARDAKRLGSHGTAWIATVMAFCAGFVDLGSYFELRRIYTSHMTGNTASFALRLLDGGWSDARRYGWAIACFMIGLLVSASLTHAERREGIRSAFAAALGMELALLIVFILIGKSSGAPEKLLIFLPAAAMGVQTVTLTRVGSLRVYTTYLTGTLSKFSEALTEYLFWFYDRTKSRFPGRIRRVLRITPRQESAQQVVLTAGLWVAFLGGALTGLSADSAWGPASMSVPAALLAVIIVIDLRAPVALGEVSDDELRRRKHARLAMR